jgi:type VI protein secretion system component VasK
MRRRMARRAVGRRAVRTGQQRRRRRVGTGLLGAAAVGGAGYYAGKRVANNRQYEDTQDQQIADLQDQAAAQDDADYYAQQVPPPPTPAPAPAPSAGTDMATQLKSLAQLHDSGALSDDEFTAAKQKVLAGG